MLGRGLLGIPVMLLLSGAACSPPFDLPIIWEGENVRVGSDGDLEAWCPGTMLRMDAYTGAIKDVMDVRDDLVVDFFLLENHLDEYPIEGCRRHDALGCALGGDAYSREMPNDHELVHAVRNAAGGSPAAIEEGAASYWGGLLASGDDGSGSGEGVPLGDALAAGAAGQMKLADYERMANFTSYLVHEWGPEANAELLRRTSAQTGQGGLESAFEQVFGDPLDVVATEYAASWPWCSREAMRSPFFDCAGEAIPVCDGEAAEQPFPEFWWLDEAFEVDVSCDDDHVVGVRAEWVWRDVVIDVRAGGEHAVGGLTDGADDLEITLKRCDTECSRAEPVELSSSSLGTPLDVVELQPGHHVIRIAARGPIAGPIGIGWICPD